MAHSGLRCALINSTPTIKAGTESRSPIKGRIVNPNTTKTNPKNRKANPILRLDNFSNRQEILSNMITPPYFFLFVNVYYDFTQNSQIVEITLKPNLIYALMLRTIE
jgi:hypothetical protein